MDQNRRILGPKEIIQVKGNFSINLEGLRLERSVYVYQLKQANIYIMYRYTQGNFVIKHEYS